MELTLYNTLTRTKERFQPIDPKNVRMYVCGPTVYDFAHIGNARPVIVFDLVFRLLRHVYGAENVKYIRNITDVDDKINARALRDYPDLPLNDAIRKVTEGTAAQFIADAKALGCLDPTAQPRATDNIDQMIMMIQRLIDKGHAYEAGGEVLFHVPSMPDYGQLSQRKLEEQQAGARVAVDAHKEHPADFVLWKQSGKNEPGWHSPWGRGRPGWHIECSAMSHRYFGEVFDIHGGGLDLIFPHHENEIAQTRCSFDTAAMANIWMHNGFLQVEGQKMSKSLGNFYTIDQARNNFGGYSWPGDAIRFNMLRSHYREPIDWTVASLDEAHKFLWDIYGHLDGSLAEDTPSDRVLSDLADDLNSARLRMHLSDLVKEQKIGELKWAVQFLGMSGQREKLVRHATAPGAIVYTDERQREVDAKKLVNARLEARKAKDWKRSDEIRDELAAMGVAIKDNKDGTTSWEIKR